MINKPFGQFGAYMVRMSYVGRNKVLMKKIGHKN